MFFCFIFVCFLNFFFWGVLGFFLSFFNGCYSGLKILEWSQHHFRERKSKGRRPSFKVSERICPWFVIASIFKHPFSDFCLILDISENILMAHNGKKKWRPIICINIWSLISLYPDDSLLFTFCFSLQFCYFWHFDGSQSTGK